MNGFLTPPALQAWQAGYRPIRKLSDVSGKSLSELYVVLDQREDRINNGYFAVDMTGYNPRNPNATRWVDYPASYHNNAGGVTLADGHAVIRHGVCVPIKVGTKFSSGRASIGGRTKDF